MKFVSAASILLLALPSAFSQRRGNGERRKLKDTKSPSQSLKSCKAKSEKKSGCYLTADFNLVPDRVHSSSISFPNPIPFGIGVGCRPGSGLENCGAPIKDVAHDGKLGHKKGHTEGNSEYTDGDDGDHDHGHDHGHDGGHDGYIKGPDFAGTVFMNRGFVDEAPYSSHYSIKCHVMKAGLYNDYGRRGLDEWNKNNIRGPPVRVEKVICELDICTEGDFSPVEDDCVYIRYSGPFGMQFDMMSFDMETSMMPLLPNFVGAVTGGTGSYRGATGVAVVKPSAGSPYSLVQASPGLPFPPYVQIAYEPSDLVHYDFGDMVDESTWFNGWEAR